MGNKKSSQIEAAEKSTQETTPHANSEAPVSGSPDEESEDDILEEVKEVLADPTPKKMKQFLVESSMGMEIMGQLSQESTIAKKITPEHINEFLSASRENMVKSFQERRESKVFTFALVVVALAFIVVLIILLKDKPDIMEKVIFSVVSLVAGAFGGYGVGRRKRRQDEDE